MLAPREEGQGRMISTFHSHEFGLGITITDDQLKKVHETTRRGEVVLIRILQDSKEEYHKTSFVLEFEYGVKHESYWHCECMVLQLQDCIDSLKANFPEFD
jgi:hypothetical protein